MKAIATAAAYSHETFVCPLLNEKKSSTCSMNSFFRPNRGGERS